MPTGAIGPSWVPDSWALAWVEDAWGPSPFTPTFGPPHVLLRGIVQRPRLAGEMRAEISAVDALFSDFGPFGPGAVWPKWTYGDLDIAAPHMTADTKAQAIPSLVGEVTDKGARDPLTNVLAEKGLLPFGFLGMFDLGADSPPPPPTEGKTFEAVLAELQASHTAGTLVADYGGRIGVSDAGVLQAMSAVPTTYYDLAAVIGRGDLDALMAEGETDPPTSTEWGFLPLSLGEIYHYLQIFGSDLGGGDPMAQHDRTLLDPSARADILAPGWIWPFADNYRRFTNAAGREFWISGIYVRGPLLSDHIHGKVTMTCNAIGRIGADGLPVMTAERWKQFWLENDLFNEWTSGDFADATTFPKYRDDTPKVNAASFAEREQFFIDKLGEPLGFVLGFYAATQRPTLDVARNLNDTTESRLGINRDGQIIDWGIDERIDPSDPADPWPRIDHDSDIFGPLTITSGEQRENVVEGVGDRDYDKDRWRLGPIKYTSDVGVAKYKNRKRPIAQPIEFLTNDEPAIRWALQRRLARLNVGVTLVEATGPIGWADRDVGKGVLFNSEEGPGPNGYVNRPMIVTRLKINVRDLLVTATFLDVGDILLTTRFGDTGTARRFQITDDTGIKITDDTATAPKVLL